MAARPAIYQTPDNAREGSLLSYGADFESYFITLRYMPIKFFVVRAPSELPVRMPMKFIMVINHKTNKVLGITVPPSILATANDVIEWAVRLPVLHLLPLPRRPNAHHRDVSALAVAKEPPRATPTKDQHRDILTVGTNATVDAGPRKGSPLSFRARAGLTSHRVLSSLK